MGLYLVRSLCPGQRALYGALGAFIFFILWLYYGSVVFIIGAEVGWNYEQARTNPLES
jgi:uncharacterized BrkB/YihY/UPF0761 family membrane protein